jgi:hypothetical protein
MIGCIFSGRADVCSSACTYRNATQRNDLYQVELGTLLRALVSPIQVVPGGFATDVIAAQCSRTRNISSLVEEY